MFSPLNSLNSIKDKSHCSGSRLCSSGEMNGPDGIQIKEGENKVTTVRPRNVVRLLKAPLELDRTKIGAEDSERALLPSQDSSL